MADYRVTWKQLNAIARDWMAPKHVLATTLVRVLGPNLAVGPISDLQVGETPRFVPERETP